MRLRANEDAEHLQHGSPCSSPRSSCLPLNQTSFLFTQNLS